MFVKSSCTVSFALLKRKITVIRKTAKVYLSSPFPRFQLLDIVSSWFLAGQYTTVGLGRSRGLLTSWGQEVKEAGRAGVPVSL